MHIDGTTTASASALALASFWPFSFDKGCRPLHLQVCINFIRQILAQNDLIYDELAKQ